MDYIPGLRSQCELKLPDGQRYWLMIFNNNAKRDSIIGEVMWQCDFMSRESRYVFAIDDKNLVNELGSQIKKEFKKSLVVTYGKTTWFKTLAANWPTELDWSNYRQEYFISPYQGTYNLINPFANLMYQSFGTSREYVLRYHEEGTYLVRDKLNKGILGTFTLRRPPFINEYQLHSVAGKGDHAMILQTPNKLPILMSAVRAVLGENLEEPEARLTFSSSKPEVIEKYTALGFQGFNRASILVEAK